MDDTYLRAEDVARLTGYSLGTLQNMRSEGRGPSWTKPAGANRVLYRRAAVVAWIEAGQQPGTAG